MFQVQASQDGSLAIDTILTVAILLFLYQWYSRICSKRRLIAVRNRPQVSFADNKVVVALQIDDIFVDLVKVKQPHYKRVNIKTTGFVKLISRIQYLFGLGLYYKPRTSLRQIRSLLHMLASNPKIDLYLYTHLHINIATYLLHKLHIQHYFPIQRRRSCIQQHSEVFKHPTQVDFNTKRVIIVTNSRDDHNHEEYSKYFMIIKKDANLSDSLWMLNDLIERNLEIDQLHNQLAEIKAGIQSDYEVVL